MNLTDKDSRIMPKSGGVFEQAYNGQIAVDNESRLIVTNHIIQATNDVLELEQTLEKLTEVGQLVDKKINTLSPDSGYYSKDNVEHCVKAEITPLIAIKREKHNKPLMERFEFGEEAPKGADAVTTMKYRLKTKKGKELYGKRKSTVEPVFWDYKKHYEL